MDQEQERGISIDLAKYSSRPTFTVKDITMYVLVVEEPKFDVPSYNFKVSEIADQLLKAGHISQDFADQLTKPLTDDHRLMAPKDTDWFSLLLSLDMDLREPSGRSTFLALLIRFRLEVGVKRNTADKMVTAVTVNHQADISHALAYLDKRLIALRNMPEFNPEDIAAQFPRDFPEPIDFDIDDDEKVVNHPFGAFIQHPQNKPSKRNKRKFSK